MVLVHVPGVTNGELVPVHSTGVLVILVITRFKAVQIMHLARVKKIPGHLVPQHRNVPVRRPIVHHMVTVLVIPVPVVVVHIVDRLGHAAARPIVPVRRVHQHVRWGVVLVPATIVVHMGNAPVHPIVRTEPGTPKGALVLGVVCMWRFPTTIVIPMRVATIQPARCMDTLRVIPVPVAV